MKLMSKILIFSLFVSLITSCNNDDGTNTVAPTIPNPTNLVINATTSATNNFEVTVAPTANNATTFEILFGDEEAGTTPKKISSGQSSTNVYEAAGSYKITVTASGAGEKSITETETITIASVKASITLPIDFEESSDSYETIGFGSADFTKIPVALVANPDKSGNNTSDNVLEIMKPDGAQTWAGASVALDMAIDWTSGTTIKVNVWSPRANTPILVKIEDTNSTLDENDNPTVFAEITAVSTMAMAWEDLTFNMSAFSDFDTSKTYDRIIFFPDFGNKGTDETFYFDDARVTETETVTAVEPNDAPPTPTEGADVVISLFSDAYTDVAVDTWRTAWSNATLEDLDIDSNPVKKYSALSFVGIETITNQIDATSMTHFRTDIWTADAKSFKIKLVDFGEDGAFEGGDDVEHEVTIDAPTQNQWVSLDIPLSDFVGLTKRGNISQLIYSADPSTANTVFVDNVYFYDDGSDEDSSSGNAPSGAAPNPTLNADNVISMFSGVYTDVPVDTWRTVWSSATLEDTQVDGNDVKKYVGLNVVGIETVTNQINASMMTDFHFDFWTPDATQIRVKLVDFGPDGAFDGGDDTEHEIVIDTPTQGEWVSMTIPLSDFTGLTTTKNIAQLIFSGDPSGEITLYVDNIYFNN